MNWQAPFVRWTFVAALLVLFGSLLYRQLAAANYPRRQALAFSGVALAHPAFANLGIAVEAIALALAAYALASTAIGFAARQDVRRIVLLGGSLAGVELVNPASGAIAILLLPLALRKWLVADHAERTAGLVMAVLFIPVLTAALLLYFWLLRQWGSVGWPTLAVPWTLSAIVSVAILAMALPTIACLALRPFAPVRGAAAIAAICAVIVLSGGITSALGAGEHPLSSAAAIGPVTVVLLCQWEPKPLRSRYAALAVIAVLALSWSLAALLGRFNVAQ